MRVRQVLDNLIDNALRHTPPGGAITVAARITRGMTEISVRDTGPGFAAPEQLHRNLARGSDTLFGHGLGLRIADTVAASHSGRLLLANLEPHGAMVTLELGRATVGPADERLVGGRGYQGLPLQGSTRGPG